MVEQTATGYSSYAPDVPGCVATGGTRDEVEREMKDALATWPVSKRKAWSFRNPRRCPRTSRSLFKWSRAVLTLAAVLSS